MQPTIVVTLPLPEPVLAGLRSHFDVIDCSGSDTRNTLADRVKDAQAILCSVGSPVPAGVIGAGTQLKVISSISVGVDHIDLAAATAAGIPVGHTPGVLVDSTADLALGLMLAVTRRIPEADRFVRAGGWQAGWSTGFFLGSDLSRATVGIIGLGPIGQAVARRVQGFGARTIGWNRTARDVAGVEAVDLDTLFSTADIVTVHAALTPDTHHLVSAERLASMKDGAILINTARGGLVDEDALINELDAGRLRAGLDVFDQEPLPQDSPLMALDSVVMLPHLGSATADTRRAMMERAMANLQAGLSDQALPFCANPGVYEGR